MEDFFTIFALITIAWAPFKLVLMKQQKDDEIILQEMEDNKR